MAVEVIDDYTFKCKFHKPHWLFWDTGGPISGGYMYHFAPAHYLKTLHPKYNPEIKDYALLQEKFPSATGMIYCNPDLPVLCAWKTVEYVPGQRLVAERNPYYWKVDPDGKQLPYLDKWVHTQVEDMRVVPLRIVGGEVDFMARSITFDAFTEIKTAEEQGNYRMILWKVGGGGDPMFIFNWEHKDPEIRTLFRTREFKLGLSHALDRETINNVVYLGQGAVSQGVTSPYSPWGRTTEEGKQLMEQWRTLAIEYDVDKANAYLDDCGLDKKDADGFRLLPSGKRLVLVMITGNPPESRAVDVMEMAVEQWRAVGVDITLNVQEPAAVSERRTTADYDIDGWDAWTGYHIPTIPDTLFPVGAGYCGFRGTALWYNTKGAQGEAPTPGDPMDQLIQIYEKMIASTTDEERNKWVLEGVKIHINEGPFMLAAVNDIPNIVVARKNMLNIPPFAFTGSWAQGAPGCTHPPLYFYKV
jgi:peptide/nickel transport system substrate-binding protein